ncbi:MAG TPA: response regulator [bacterium]|nr:response regulator [bacterium]
MQGDPTKARPILVVDDDADDRMMIEKALRKEGVENPIRFLGNGEELMDYLKRKGDFSKIEDLWPCFILLDLNMPRMDGRKALLFIKADPEVKKIPVLVLSTSNAEEDIMRSYNLGANSFIRKPVNFEDLLAMARSLKNYWLKLVELPPGNSLAHP